MFSTWSTNKSRTFPIQLFYSKFIFYYKITRTIRCNPSYLTFKYDSRRPAVSPGLSFPRNLNASSDRGIWARWDDWHIFKPIRERELRTVASAAFRPMATFLLRHVCVSRQKRFRAKTVRALFRCRSAGTITTITITVTGSGRRLCTRTAVDVTTQITSGCFKGCVCILRLYFLMFPVLSDCFLRAPT